MIMVHNSFIQCQVCGSITSFQEEALKTTEY